MAAHVLEASAADIQFADGRLTVVGTDKSIALVDLARRSFAPVGWPAELGVGLEAVGTFTPARTNFANGCHICEVEVDPDTGQVEIVRYMGVDDSGLIINPLLFEGQIHGGLAMGLAPALLEEISYDEDGNVQGGSFMDYLVPTSMETPSWELDKTITPSPHHPFGAKGVGESATVGAPPAIANAVVDALSHLGVKHIDIPITPEKVWKILKEKGVAE